MPGWVSEPVWRYRRRQKFSCLYRYWNHDYPVILPAAYRLYITYWSIPPHFNTYIEKKNVQINLYRSQIIYIQRKLHILYNNTAESALTKETPLCLRNQKSQKCLQQYCTCGTKLRFQLQKSGCLWRIYTSKKIKQIRVIISLQHTRSLGTWLIEVNIDITFYDLSLYVHTSTEVITFTGCS
jgi:hypothetical protein